MTIRHVMTRNKAGGWVKRELSETEKAQRARLEEMLRGRPRPALSVEDFGVPHLDESL